MAAILHAVARGRYRLVYKHTFLIKWRQSAALIALRLLNDEILPLRCGACVCVCVCVRVCDATLAHTCLCNKNKKPQYPCVLRMRAVSGDYLYCSGSGRSGIARAHITQKCAPSGSPCKHCSIISTPRRAHAMRHLFSV